MEHTGRRARNYLDSLLATAKEYGGLQMEVERLKEELALARAFMSLNPHERRKVPTWAVQRLLLGVIL